MPMLTITQAWAVLSGAILLEVAGTAVKMVSIGLILIGVMGLHSASRLGQA